jgi:hypothetical protein
MIDGSMILVNYPVGQNELLGNTGETSGNYCELVLFRRIIIIYRYGTNLRCFIFAVEVAQIIASIVV